MKILYVAGQRGSAEQAAHALRTIAPNVKLIWAQTPASALRWVQEKNDVTAFWIDAQVQSDSASGFVDCVRGLLKAAPVMVVVPENLQAPLGAVKALTAEGVMQQRLKSADQEAQQQLALALQHVEQRAAKTGTALQNKLLELEGALRHAEQQRASEAAASVERLAQRHAEFTASLAHAARSRDALAQQLTEATAAVAAEAAALNQERQARTADGAAAAERLARREEELGTALAQATAARTAIEQRLAEVEAAHRHAEQRAGADMAAASAQIADLQKQHADAITRHAGTIAEQAETIERITAARDDFGQQLAAAKATVTATAASLDATAAALEEERHARTADGAAAAQRLANREEELGTALAQAIAARSALESRLADVEATHRQADEHAAAEIAAGQQREAQLREQLADGNAARTTLEQSLADARTTLKDTEDRRNQESAAAAVQIEDLHEQHADAIARVTAGRDAVEQQLAQEISARTTVDRDLMDLRAASARSRRRLLAVAAEVRRHARETVARLEAELARERSDAETTIRTRDEEIQELRGEGETLRQTLHTTRDELQRLGHKLDDERQEFERTRATSEAELRRMTAEHDQVRQSLTQVRAAFQTLEQISSENAAERARLETVVAERDAQTSAQAAAHLAAEQGWKQKLALADDTHRQALEASARDIAARERQLEALGRELDLLKTDNAALKGEVDRLPVLQRQIEEMQKENRRQFHRSPFAMCRCNREGKITHLNRALVELLGYRTADEVRKVDLATDVFEDAADLKWSIERSGSTGSLETLETTWKKADRSRLIVRLHVLAATDESVEIIAEDVTRVRTVEERLRQAERMEAVGRLASEVAVTCDNLLRDVSQGGQEWLAGIGSDPALRHQGEQLLGEVTRAASFLRQFATYGNKQLSALAPVDVQQVLRELAPVLTRVAGDDIELELPKSTAPIEVDVDRERVERVLVNVASYARERMPYGGRVKIDLGSAIVDRGFLAKYPNVRPGAHALITVTEVRSADAPPASLALAAAPTDAGAPVPAAEKPGVDLSALMQLIRNCGGHLWMTAEPPGNMTLKIRLPKRRPDSGIDAESAAQSNRGRSLTRWFRH